VRPAEPRPIGPGLSHKNGPVFVGEGQRPALEQPGWIERERTAPTSPVTATEPTGFREPVHEANYLFLLTNKKRVGARVGADPLSNLPDRGYGTIPPYREAAKSSTGTVIPTPSRKNSCGVGLGIT
jgi:hypothetical protein